MGNLKFLNCLFRISQSRKWIQNVMQLMLMLKKVNSGLLESSNRIEIILSVGLVPKLLECFNYTATYCHLICLNFIARSFWHCWRRNQSLDEKVNALIWLVLSVVQALSLLNWLVTLNCYRRRSKLDWWSTAIPVVPFLAVPFSPGCLVFTSTLLSRPSAVLGWATSLQLAVQHRLQSSRFFEFLMNFPPK